MVVRMLQRVWKRVASLGVMSGLRRHATVDRLARAFRHSRAVKQPLRFALREVACRGDVATYPLQDLNLRFSLRHNGHDAWVLHEVLGRRSYAPPPAVEAALSRSGTAPTVIDLGAHLGFFGLFILSLYPRARILSVEPDRENAALLAETIRRSGHDRWELVHACASTAGGSVPFAAGLAERSHIITDTKAGGNRVTAIDIFDRLGEVDLLKMDIEGGEWPILDDERFATVEAPAIALEYHAFGCHARNPRQAALKRLEEAGYVVREPPAGRLGADVGLLWGWRRANHERPAVGELPAATGLR
jgi:FkbM family methyltransferase